MSFASETGYVPSSIPTLMDAVRLNINDQFGTDYTTDSFVGTNHYKYFYALIQELQANEVKTAEIFAKLQQFFVETNQSISRPVATSPGIIEKLSLAGFTASIKPPEDADAGKVFIAVDVVDDHARGSFTITSYANLVSGTHDTVTVGATVFTAQATSVTHGGGTFQAATSNAATATSLADQINNHATAGALVKAVAVGAVVYLRAIARGTGGNAIALAYTDHDTNVGATKSGTTLLGGISADADYNDVRLAICTVIKNSAAAGIVSQGLEVETIVLTNGQSFDFKFTFPNRIETLLRLTTTLSENNQHVILSPEAQKAALLANIAAKYKLGKNFEPQQYFSVVDAPWASQVVLEYSVDNGANWLTAVYDADYDDLLEVSLANTTLVES